ncbi:MAG: arsenite efflux transporter metallochaperone ArsD [Synergistaceae bacterium]|nr:arsenite efflux transporter metallochaperone ArsD [Synergistaceae bacterium]
MNTVENGSIQAPAIRKTLKVYDPALCCSSGVCGPSVDPELARFAGTLEFLKRLKSIAVERYNMGQDPRAFAENVAVLRLLSGEGAHSLPFVFVDDELLFHSRYPSREEILGALGLEGESIRESVATRRGCCAEGGCCR